jgi:6-phosphogluconolactonase
MRIATLFLSLLALASAADTRIVYIGTYPSETSKGIYAFRFDDTSGALAPLGLVAETPRPSFLTASTNGRFVFAVNELSTFDGQPTGSVTSFAVDQGTAKLTEINVQPSGGAAPCHLALDRTGRYLAIANYSGGNFALLPVGPDGRLQRATTVVDGRATAPASAKPLGHAVGFDAANRFLVAADLGLDRVLVFRFDASSGTLTPHTPPAAELPTGSGPRHYAFHPVVPWLFTIDELASTITRFAWAPNSGRLTLVGSVPTKPAGVEGGTTAEIAVHPSGRFVYGSNRGHDSIAVFRVGANGVLTLVEHELTRGQTPRNFALDPSGRWLIAANQRSNTLAVFRVDQSTGALTPVGPLASVGSPVNILFM